MKICLLFVISIFISPLTVSAPSAFTNQCGLLKVVNQTTSTILSDNKDCKTVWVLPPTYGLARLSGYMKNGNLGLCEEVKEVQALSLNLVKRIATLTEELSGKTVEYKKREEDLLKAQAEIYEVETSPEIREKLQTLKNISVFSNVALPSLSIN